MPPTKKELYLAALVLLAIPLLAEVALRVARLMAPLMNWSAEEERAQFNHYVEEWKRSLP